MTLSVPRLMRFTIGCLLVAATAGAQYAFDILTEFESPLVGIQGGILKASDGALYGTSYGGGLNQLGGIFRVQPDGSGFTVLRFFDVSDGYAPFAALIEGADGALYGTAQSGGFGFGTVFRLQRDGTGFAVLHTFDGVEGSYPYGGLVQAGDGTLYGAVTQGGSSGAGAIYKIQPDGSAFTSIHVFAGPDGSSPRSTLTLAGGVLYGTAYQGGLSNSGTIFALGLDGSGFATLHSFSAGEGTNPNAPTILATDGALYGTASMGGASGFGTVFKIQTNGSGFTVLASLPATTGYAAGGVIQGLDGALYGPGQFCCGGGTIYRIQTDGSNFAQLHSLTPLEGSGPITPLVQASDGTLFGVTQVGGSSDFGAVFKLDPDGANFATLYSLKDETGAGALLLGGVALGTDSRVYGVTNLGGSSGAGTLFGVDRDGGGNFTVLRSLGQADGRRPWGGLILGLDGALYGTTQFGGAFDAGAVFKIQPDGSGFTILYSFNGGDGNQPLAALTQGPDGTLYGTSFAGVFKLQPDGTGFAALGGQGFFLSSLTVGPDGMLYGAAGQGGSSGAGTVFRLSTDGSAFSELHAFAFSGSDGFSPNAVIVGLDGALYGTTRSGGDFGGGTIFRMAMDGSAFTTLRSLSGFDGVSSVAALLQAPDGSLVGTTQGGGSNGRGTVFSMTPDGIDLTVLYAFSGADGAAPSAPVVRDSSGALYGTTYQGGPRGGGVVFRLSPPAPAFTLSVQDAAAVEGSVAHFSVTLSAVSSATVTVAYATSDGTAKATLDYQAASGTLTFLPGETAKTIPVSLLPDHLDENDETFLLSLSSPVNASIGDGLAVGTILDDDPEPSLSILDVAVREGSQGPHPVGFHVLLSKVSGRDVSAHFATSDGTAVAPGDYTAASGVVTIPAGQREATIDIVVVGDRIREPTESFSVTLSSPTNAMLRRSVARCTLLNDDSAHLLP